MSVISNRKDQHNPENSISIYLKKFQITDLNKMQKESLKTISSKKDVVLLSPTGSDLEKNDVGAIFAGYHFDISFLTIHGKSRYPGLYCWTR